MLDESLTLKVDGSYVYTVTFDMGRDEEKGAWKVKDGFVVLSAKKKGSTFKGLPSRFLVLARKSDLVLRVEDGSSEGSDEDDVRFWFRRENKGANQPPEPTR